MSFTNIKTKSQGFTIVELLIVVVVIAILAAITIVSYNGITTRANDSAAESLAATWRKKVELYQSENGRYPVSMSEMSANTNDSWYITNSSVQSAALTSDTGKTKVQVQACAASGTTAPTTSTVAAMKIIYWNYDGGTTGATTITLGTTTATGTGCTSFS